MYGVDFFFPVPWVSSKKKHATKQLLELLTQLLGIEAHQQLTSVDGKGPSPILCGDGGVHGYSVGSL